MINADTHERIDVLPDRKSDTLAAWLREHPGAEIVVRDGSTAYAEAVRRSVPAAQQVSDRWQPVATHVIPSSSATRWRPPSRQFAEMLPLLKWVGVLDPRHAEDVEEPLTCRVLAKSAHER